MGKPNDWEKPLVMLVFPKQIQQRLNWTKPGYQRKKRNRWLTETQPKRSPFFTVCRKLSTNFHIWPSAIYNTLIESGMRYNTKIKRTVSKYNSANIQNNKTHCSTICIQQMRKIRSRPWNFFLKTNVSMQPPFCLHAMWNNVWTFQANKASLSRLTTSETTVSFSLKYACNLYSEFHYQRRVCNQNVVPVARAHALLLPEVWYKSVVQHPGVFV